MSVLIEIKKKCPGFLLDVSYESLSVRIGVLGAAGSGKSLLLKCIAGIEKPDLGRIQVHGRTVYDSMRHTNIKIQKRRIGYLTTDYALFPGMSVENNILCGYRGKRAQGEKAAAEYIRRFALNGLEDTYPDQLTDLAKFRTAIARTLIGEPQLFLLDEPFLGKEGYQKKDLLAEFSGYLKDFEGGYILTTKNPEEIYRLCDSVIVLDRGSVLAVGTVKEIFEKPVSLGTARLTGCRNFSRIEIRDEYHVQALDWGIALRTEWKVDPDCTHIGIRSCHIKAAEGIGQNCMPIHVLQAGKRINSVEYEVKNSMKEDGSSLFWEVDREESVPSGLFFPPDKLMLLK